MKRSYDVIVIGSGLGGTAAAIEAARAGARTAILCAGPLFSGSSFFPGTWGLGLIGPRSASDAGDLIASIEHVGGGVADHALVSSFVHGIPDAISWLVDDLDVQLKRPANEQSAQETAFIPCFDHTPRLWRGITREAYLAAARRELSAHQVDVLERCELIDLLDAAATNGVASAGGRNAIDPDAADSPQASARRHAICGLVYLDLRTQKLHALHAGSIVLASGGTGGLFERSLTARDVESSAHGIALTHGAELTNIEFMQMMPGLLAPKRNLVFNEKTFRYIDWIAPAGRSMLPDGSALRDVLEVRSSHGPFTSRLGDHAVDLAIAAAGDEGLAIRYRFPTRNVPEFVQTFAHWMEHEHGIAPDAQLRIAMYAHASNGGIRIDEAAWTGVEGLYACGELTGGMHGADRIGGLASANALVFGRRAGQAAAAHALRHPHESVQAPCVDTGDLLAAAPALGTLEARTLTKTMRHAMTRACMVQRNADGLHEAALELEHIATQVDARQKRLATDAHDAASHANALRLASQLRLARAMVHAMAARTRSLGSHYRTDGTQSVL